MLGGSFIIQGMKNALKVMGKGARGLAKLGRSAARGISQTGLYKKSAKAVKTFGTRMAKNIRTKRWWGKAVRVIRSSRTMLGLAGSIGASLKRSGGLLGFLGRGLSIFNTDYRSPKEFRQDMKEKEKMIKSLRAKRVQLIEREIEAQKELKAKIETEGIETPEEKLDEIARHLSLMKEALAEVKATSYTAATNVKGFESYQVKANEQLADAINHGADANLKSLVGGLEDVKDNTSAVVMDSTQSIVGDISAKIDTIEEQRREEEEFRRKNDWKRKFLNSVLFLADWILNFPYKIAMLGLKLVALIGAGLAIYLLPFYNKIGAMIYAVKNGLGAIVGGIIGLKLVEFGAWIATKIGGLIKWLATGMSDLFFDLRIWIANQFAKLPWVKSFFQGVADTLKSAKNSSKELISNAVDSIISGYQQVKDWSKDQASTLLSNLEDQYNASKKDKPLKVEATAEDVQNKSKEGLVAMQAKNAEPDNTSTSASEQETSTESSSTQKEDKGLLGKITSFAQEKTESTLSGAEKMYKEHDVSSKIEIISDKVSKVKKEAVDKTNAVIEKYEVKEKIKETSDKTAEALESVSRDLQELKQSTKEALVGKSSDSGKSAPSIQKGSKVAFKESGEQYANLIQRS